MDTNFVVYGHTTQDTGELFYIGEGRPSRAYSKHNRNRFWRHKVARHGFNVEVLHAGLSKQEAESTEARLIAEALERGDNLVNLCEGTIFGTHWLVGKPKELHPMWGKRFNAPWISESNRRRTGTKLKPRPDLAERNKKGNFRRCFKKVRCVETNVVFHSLTAAAEAVGVGISKISRAIQTGWRAGGFHWKFELTPSEEEA
jgi:hypothetical protein